MQDRNKLLESIVTQLTARIDQLEHEVHQLNRENKFYSDQNKYLEEEVDILNRRNFVRFNDDECLPWCPDNRDLENIVCPIVIDPRELKVIVDKSEVYDRFLTRFKDAILNGQGSVIEILEAVEAVEGHIKYNE